jgi:hypothetical protein
VRPVSSSFSRVRMVTGEGPIISTMGNKEPVTTIFSI